MMTFQRVNLSKLKKLRFKKILRFSNSKRLMLKHLEEVVNEKALDSV